jgi:hypothetical protein
MSAGYLPIVSRFVPIEKSLHINRFCGKLQAMSQLAISVTGTGKQ